MRTDLRMRLGLLVALAVVGVVVAGVGTTLGGATPTAATGGEFVISEGSITYTNQDQEVLVKDEMANVTTVEITEADEGRFRIETDRTRPLSVAERKRAREIARGNDTVESKLAAIATPRLTVDPIKQIETNAMQFNVSVTAENESRGVTVFEVEKESIDTGESGVVVDRDLSYVDDRAVVRISDTEKEGRSALQYSVRVDLANKTVTEITNWTAIRAGEPTVTSIDSSVTTTSAG